MIVSEEISNFEISSELYCTLTQSAIQGGTHRLCVVSNAKVPNNDALLYKSNGSPPKSINEGMTVEANVCG